MTVEFSEAASEHASAIHSWWSENRPSSPNLFKEELSALVGQLEASPYSGTPYSLAEIPAVRRVALHRTRYHLYYVFDEITRVVCVHAIWHMSRGHGPVL